VLFTCCRVSFKRKCCKGTIITQDRSFLKGNEENPALVLSNVHNRTSARDGPMFGSKGPSMNTSSLDKKHIQTVLFKTFYITFMMEFVRKCRYGTPSNSGTR
jgi:hypothetical protein